MVELIGGYTLAKDLVLKAIDNGKHVVTANKALLAHHGQALAELVGCDIDGTGPALVPRPRAARRAVAGLEIRRQAGRLDDPAS